MRLWQRIATSRARLRFRAKHLPFQPQKLTPLRPQRPCRLPDVQKMQLVGDRRSRRGGSLPGSMTGGWHCDRAKPPWIAQARAKVRKAHADFTAFHCFSAKSWVFYNREMLELHYKRCGNSGFCNLHLVLLPELGYLGGREQIQLQRNEKKKPNPEKNLCGAASHGGWPWSSSPSSSTSRHHCPRSATPTR